MWNTLVQRASLLNWGQSFGSFEAARREQHSCSVCQRWRAQPINPKTLYPAWLRLHISTEMYCFGPLQVRVGRWREKHWGLLFTFRRWWQEVTRNLQSPQSFPTDLAVGAPNTIPLQPTRAPESGGPLESKISTLSTALTATLGSEVISHEVLIFLVEIEGIPNIKLDRPRSSQFVADGAVRAFSRQYIMIQGGLDVNTEGPVKCCLTVSGQGFCTTIWRPCKLGLSSEIQPLFNWIMS